MLTAELLLGTFEEDVKLEGPIVMLLYCEQVAARVNLVGELVDERRVGIALRTILVRRNCFLCGLDDCILDEIYEPTRMR